MCVSVIFSTHTWTIFEFKKTENCTIDYAPIHSKKNKHSRATCKYPVSCSNRIFTRRATHSCMCNSWLSSLITIMMFSGGDVAQDVAGEPARTQQQQQQGRNPTPTPVRLSSSWPPCSQRAAESRSQDVTADSQRKSQQWGEVGLRSRTHKYTLYIIL